MTEDESMKVVQPRRDYLHELNTEVRSISGGYNLEEEGRIEIREREVLYAVGNAIVDSACCGAYGCHFAVVPGYVLKWKYKRSADGVFISAVEPITDHLVKKQIENTLQDLEGVTQVVFW
ncbi:MAG: hypothetical protein HY912_20770 [Desulfomonile tiedjei]|uniref:Uncharacterized protein n=1 Tax=Desulfomonile tiedjei TaxID=2358 RepID=A0A9D6V4Y7_9BACT|nr:hypothetical protein [Desulfomonile tiedjei]